MKENIATSSRTVLLTIKELISRFELYNDADGKSPKTIKWYSEILTAYLKYLDQNRRPLDISSINVEDVRGYMLYLRHRKRFEGHPYTPIQESALSSQTIRGHVRTIKVFSSWLYREKCNDDNVLKDLKLPKATSKTIIPLTSDEINVIIGCIDKNSSIA